MRASKSEAGNNFRYSKSWCCLIKWIIFQEQTSRGWKLHSNFIIIKSFDLSEIRGSKQKGPQTGRLNSQFALRDQCWHHLKRRFFKDYQLVEKRKWQLEWQFESRGKSSIQRRSNSVDFSGQSVKKRYWPPKKSL